MNRPSINPLSKPVTQRTAKANRTIEVAADHGAARRVRRWCTSPVNTHRVTICTDPPPSDRASGDD